MITTEAMQQEAAATSTSTLHRPLKKIGTLPISWLEYNARSKNGRIYPKATCDAIFRAAQRQLAETNAPDPPTTFVSHEDANGNKNIHLIGAPVKVWQEGPKFWAHIDIADTSIARDILALVEGRYLRSGSMRVLGVELMHDRNYDLPLVVVPEGVEPKFLGIDLTTNPGLADTAYIPHVLYESSGQPPYIESFDFEILPIEEEAPNMSIPLYLQVIAESMTPDRAAHQRIHDHLAGVMDAAVKPMHGSESARLIALVEAELTEEGRVIAIKHAVKIAAAHDEAAKQLGMECSECYKEALGLPLDADQDNGDAPGDQDSNSDQEDGDESAKAPKKGTQKIMTEAEMLAALKAKGYQVAAPKTIQEEVEELRAKVTALESARSTEAPQRQTQAPSAMTETGGYTEEPIYEEGEYLAGPLKPSTWKSLANRRVPWPQDVDPNVALHELAPFLAYRLLETEANAMGRDVSAFVGAHEQI